MNAQDVIIKPYITEKSSEDLAYGKYTFIVNRKATKTQIRQAVEELFDVKVLNVNTANFKGKIKRMGAHQGPRPAWKKAVIKIDTDPVPDSYYDSKGKEVVVNRKYKTGIEEFGVTQ